MAEQKRTKSLISKREEEILKFWKENNIFQKSLKKDSPKGEFIFYDGPPFATGTPHYGHFPSSTMKDVIPRFKTMQGYHVPRVWGWDCHGLPIENLVEKELGLKSKKDIEEYGIEKFNEAARANVLRYDAEWKKTIPRLGRWIDMDLAYLTMNWTYSESIWWSFKTLYDKNLIYQGFKAMHICPHDETTLSNMEVGLNYKDITDLSVYVRFELVDESPSTSSGQTKTYVLVWTTTPWTLPGNIALAVNPDIQYVRVKTKSENKEENFILAKELLPKLQEKFESQNLKIERTEDTNIHEYIGKKYKPAFDYYANADLKNKENIWKIVPADFVTTTDGTGVVHIAPGYGEDDYNLSLKENLPFVQHVGIDGKFKKEVTDFAGMLVKPKDTPEDKNKHQEADIEIIKYLAGKGSLFAKEKIVHSYPHCWRCDTPLLNYATNSWFVKVTDIKDKLVSENSKINWVPPEIGEGRFGKWLEGARDWAISRSRFWGAPLPVWICNDCGKTEVIGSVEDLRKKTKSSNRYFVMRHGEAESNVKNILSGDPKEENHVTDNGKKQVEESLKILKNKKIDLIISSDFVRTKETAEIVAQELGINIEHVVYDPRLGEYGVGDFHGKSIDEWHAYWQTKSWNDADAQVPGGESPVEVQARIFEALEDMEARYKNKNILIVSHDDPIRYMLTLSNGQNIKTISKEHWYSYVLQNAEVREMNYSKLPKNRKLELDLHRPYIDEIKFGCACGGTFHRVPEVFDTWYESGSMPYGQLHYPFENKNLIDKKKQFPADFIAEGQDQTRGWFYSLLVLSTGLFGHSPYKNVMVNGTILAEDGQKMSKRLKNYPEVSHVLDTYGADAVRYYLLSSGAVRAEDLAFSERGVDEVVKKILLRLQNVYTFYATYESENRLKERKENKIESKNILDVWITARLNELGETVTKNLENYELDKAARPFANFVDDLSTWYLRRSRERFKGDDKKDKAYALQTTKYILIELSKLLAPFMPFIAEDLYLKVAGKSKLESVHLERWSEFETPDEKILKDMTDTRFVVSLALQLRSDAGIKIRQPLSKLTINQNKFNLSGEFGNLIQEELNVKEVVFTEKDLGEQYVALDVHITEELKEEGQAREFIRSVQELRKKAKLDPHDVVTLSVMTDDVGKNLLEKFKEEIVKTAKLKDILFKSKISSNGRALEDISIDTLAFMIALSE